MEVVISRSFIVVTKEAGVSGRCVLAGHGGQAAGQFANAFFLTTEQFVNVDDGGAKVHTQITHVANFLHHCCHLQQPLFGDAAHVQAYAAQRGVARDQHALQCPLLFRNRHNPVGYVLFPKALKIK